MSDAFAWLYSDVVKEHFMNPKNVFNPDDGFTPDAEGVTGNIKCGDQMMFILKIEDDVIDDVRWKTYGCASAIASTSMLSEVIKGLLDPRGLQHQAGRHRQEARRPPRQQDPLLRARRQGPARRDRRLPGEERPGRRLQKRRARGSSVPASTSATAT